jgi:serine/threonine-protein kinase
MGSVWRAQHRTLGRSFAIKFLKTNLMGGELLEQRFLAEARMAASVRHRFVVDLVDYGVTSDAVPFMVMEFLEGESLERRCRRRPPLAVAELLRMGAEVLLGLEAVHQAGIIHRDLKPDNVMLVHQADGTIPKLVDFGISRMEVEPDQGAPRITHPGAVLGTPWYMSPEQARRDRTDRRSDIYSMGVILYEALAGAPPFDDPELAGLLEKVRVGGATPLRLRRPELGDELSGVIEQAMCVEPSARFESAAQMAARLLEQSSRVPATLACVAAPGVSRTDTEIVERVPRRRTRELPPTPAARPVRSGRRALVYVGATLGAALLAWVTLRARPDEGRVAPATAHASVVAAPEVVASAPDESEPHAIEDHRQRTLTAPVAPAPVGEERHRRRTQARSGRREPTRVAVPEVFRTPGF